MIAIDTNVLPRAMLDDDPVQSPAARLFLQTLTQQHPGYVGVPVMLEFFWVLRSSLRLLRREIVTSIFELFGVDTLVFEESDILIRSLRYFEMEGIDFSDAVIAQRHARDGCQRTVTFDRKAAACIPSMEFLA
ncbi:PIN domain-containing protein [Aurantimonas sp. VKM B-3413]|uniref:PIN domain-containing protein n=1 Tax=Aurantimonas sp. VKM B-3413 TaxID=2779401 RepID=UPI001E4B1D64|nr:type II toxin-antitoxin system VapC family toxin [Aurantimonas sp. VKM B-3413]MCB8839266.1 type II toxin-antitoxin system VapC family toxin [Aurantimonas sp. VKM B-3413]